MYNVNALNVKEPIIGSEPVKLYPLEKNPSPKELFMSGGIITIYRLYLTRDNKLEYSFAQKPDKTFSIDLGYKNENQSFEQMCKIMEKAFYFYLFKDLLWDPNMYFITGSVYDKGINKTFIFDGFNNYFVNQLDNNVDIDVKISREYLPDIIYNRELYIGYPGSYIDDNGNVAEMKEGDWDLILRKIITAMKINMYAVPFCLTLEEINYKELNKAAKEGNSLFGKFMQDFG